MFPVVVVDVDVVRLANTLKRINVIIFDYL